MYYIINISLFLLFLLDETQESIDTQWQIPETLA